MQEKSRWKGIKSIGMICKTTEQAGEQIKERRYYISKPAVECGAVCKDSEGTLVSGNHALAFGCNF